MAELEAVSSVPPTASYSLSDSEDGPTIPPVGEVEPLLSDRQDTSEEPGIYSAETQVDRIPTPALGLLPSLAGTEGNELSSRGTQEVGLEPEIEHMTQEARPKPGVPEGPLGLVLMQDVKDTPPVQIRAREPELGEIQSPEPLEQEEESPSVGQSTSPSEKKQEPGQSAKPRCHVRRGSGGKWAARLRRNLGRKPGGDACG